MINIGQVVKACNRVYTRQFIFARLWFWNWNFSGSWRLESPSKPSEFSTIKFKHPNGTLHEIYINVTDERQAHRHFIDQIISITGITVDEFTLIRIAIHPDDSPDDGNMEHILFIMNEFFRSGSESLGLVCALRKDGQYNLHIIIEFDTDKDIVSELARIGFDIGYVENCYPPKHPDDPRLFWTIDLSGYSKGRKLLILVMDWYL
uniref:Uncharacterized protein n=1 Tax=Tetranychus urticae TaxID=32264 RepID=T1L0U5_TETUR